MGGWARSQRPPGPAVRSHDQIVRRVVRSMLVSDAGVVSGVLLRRRKVSRLYLCNRRRRFMGSRSVSMARIRHVDGGRMFGTGDIIFEVE